MGIEYLGKKSNINSFTVDKNQIAKDEIVYRFAYVSDIPSSIDCDAIALVKKAIVENENCPKIGEYHPTMTALHCTGYTMQQVSDDASNNFVIDVIATYETETSGDITVDKDYLIEYNLETSYKVVPFINSYRKEYPIPEATDLKKLREFYQQNPPRKVFSIQKTGDTITDFLNSGQEIYPVENTAGDTIDAKTSQSYNKITFKYYTDTFTHTMYNQFINTVNFVQIPIQDMTIEQFQGRITSIKYRPTTYLEYDKTTDTTVKKPIVEVSMSIEINYDGYGQMLPNNGKIFVNNTDLEDDDNKTKTRLRVYTDGKGEFGPLVTNSEEVHSTYSSEAYLIDSIKNSNLYTDEDKARLQKLIKPIDDDVTLDENGNIKTIVENGSEVLYQTYIYYLDYKPEDWSSLGFINKTTKEYKDYLGVHQPSKTSVPTHTGG